MSKSYSCKLNWGIVSVLYFLICIFASTVNAQTAEPAKKVKVGCLYPLTGLGGRYGRDSDFAIQMALGDLKEQKEEGWPELEVLIGDTRSKSLRAIQLARTYIKKDKVSFLCGVVSSRVALAVTEVANKEKTFFIGTDHASPRLVTEALHPYYFRVNNGTRQSMRAGARYIKENYSRKKLKIAFIGPDYDYGYQAWEDMRYFLKEEKVSFEISGVYWPKLFEQSYAIYVREILKRQPDILINGHWGQDLVTFVKQAKEDRLFDKTVFMNFDAGGNYEILAELGDDMPLGLVLSARHHVNWPNTEKNRRFVERFREKFGRYPSYAAEGAYAGIMAIATAVKEAGGVHDKEKLRIALENLKLSLPEDPENFMSYMDPETHQMMQVQAIGKTIRNNQYPPAKVLLGEWSVYLPPKTWPSKIKEK